MSPGPSWSLRVRPSLERFSRCSRPRNTITCVTGLKDLRVRLARFSDSFGQRKLADITSAEIDNWLRGLLLAPMTRNTFRLRLSVLFEYGRVRGWVTNNPVTAVKKVRTNEPLPAILEPEQVARLLEVASEETLPYWAIGAFAGLRSAELQRLAWRDIHFDEKLIEVARPVIQNG